jgi:hypothetical protein
MNTTMNARSAISALFLLAALGLPASLAGQSAGVPQLFHTADQCMACHNQLVAPSGQDVSIGFNWRSSMMGNSGRDPYWMAAVRRETMDHPAATAAIEDKCTVCHLAMARTTHVAEGGQGKAFQYFPGAAVPGPHALLAADGVSCTVCHQVQNVALGEMESFTGGYTIDLTTPMGDRSAVGPFEVDQGRSRLMHSASDFTPQEAPHIQSAEFCASCHTLFTHALDPQGNEVGELAEQAPYLEWKHSAYQGQKVCQDCHMPVVDGEVSVTGVLPNPRTEVNQHAFMGGNFLMPRILNKYRFLMPRILNKYRAELGVRARSQELETTSRASAENLGMKTARLAVEALEVDPGQVAVEVTVENLAGHKFPSAYPSRRAWLHTTIRDAGGNVIFESGALRPDGSIQGNDNDDDGSRFEPHYLEISSQDQVQIYEDIMVDYAGEVTTGLLWGVRYIKDNRLLPEGFDKSTADWTVAVSGEAEGDEDFVGGGDRVRYSVFVDDEPGPYQVEVELWYQPIGYRWARNLGEYDSEESARFTMMFDGVAPSSATLVARTREVVR